ncbi:N-acetylmuramoyl-L-alanine amidase [Clostridium sp. 19966]|uniref:peptidoglycan recognition protein family protein n=1 Tax=Clostridium sp. 19966 TaxID=2768166 RepID=UPI0028E03166|nr:N-acetylmuramoyl-L-alanine amidase [Clostridium sp. 19966]MDT8715429.1 N-acetylmuramoyl-L-alanine amidase [Clostridium sp. 19966]
MNIIESNLQFKALSYGNNPKLLVLHHAEATTCTIQDIHQWHLDNGWAGCGYHFLVRKDGSVYRGRPEQAIGAHCPGVNATSLGICAEGNYMQDTMPIAQKNAIVELCKYLEDKYKINKIQGHKELYSTDCPGTNYPLEDIKNLCASAPAVMTPSPTPVVAAVNNLLKLWSSGAAVNDLQTKLNKVGYNLTVDGVFGPNTFNAVQDFQHKHGLTVDGIVGPNTLAALDSAVVALSVIDINSYKYLQHELNVSEDNIPGPITLGKCPLIKLGSSGNIVKWIQNKLGIAADGIFGNQTKLAIQNFQAAHGFVADGIIGQNTWRALLGL